MITACPFRNDPYENKSGCKIAVLIVTYNRLKLLKECIDAVMSQTVAPSAVYIVDNKSEDGTAEYLEELLSDQRRSQKEDLGKAGKGITDIRIITAESNLGGAGGFALGVREASGHADFDWLVLIDDDAMLAPDFLKQMREASNNGYALMAGAVMCGGAIDTNHRRRIKNPLIFLVFLQNWLTKWNMT